MAMIHAKSRDNARTPMQWDGSANAGFTTFELPTFEAGGSAASHGRHWA
jgi:glycosidase